MQLILFPPQCPSPLRLFVKKIREEENNSPLAIFFFLLNLEKITLKRMALNKIPFIRINKNKKG